MTSFIKTILSIMYNYSNVDMFLPLFIIGNPKWPILQVKTILETKKGANSAIFIEMNPPKLHPIKLTFLNPLNLQS